MHHYNRTGQGDAKHVPKKLEKQSVVYLLFPRSYSPLGKCRLAVQSCRCHPESPLRVESVWTHDREHARDRR